MKISIGIICSNDHLIKKCLDSIPQDTPVIAVLNFPDDFVLNVVKEYKNVTIVRLDERNLGKLRQLAADSCKTEAICYIDSDCVIGDNLVEIVEKELDENYAVNIPLDFDYYNSNTKTTSFCRKFTTPDELLFMPFAFRLSLQEKIGKLFNENLSWGEDTDQRLRLNESKIGYAISKARVLHKPLTIKEDAKSAIRLGRGTRLQEIYNIKKPRSFWKDINIFPEIRDAHRCRKKSKSIRAGLYHFFIWRVCYKYGYWKARMKNGNKNKNNK